jgi:CDP-diacylglycerol---glycerol-3-phosphate 3-phosphatidyltransferase
MSSLIVLEMPGMYGLKPWFQDRLRPLVRILAAMGASANQVTVFACLLSISFGLVLSITRQSRLFVLLPLVFLARMALNAMDGMLAREFGQATELGAQLNELGDVVSDTFLYLPFTQLTGVSPTWMWGVIVLAVISEMAGTLAALTGANRRYDGPMGKSDRALVFAAMGLWIGVAGGLPKAVAYLLPIGLTLMLTLTVVNRIRKGLHACQDIRNDNGRRGAADHGRGGSMD